MNDAAHANAVNDAAPGRNEAWDGVADDLLPADLDWRRLARTYPIPVLTVAAVGGFLVGRERGPELLAAFTEFFTGRVAENVRSVLGAAGSGADRNDDDFYDDDAF